MSKQGSHNKRSASWSLLRMVQDCLLFGGLSVWLAVQTLHSRRAITFATSTFSTASWLALPKKDVAAKKSEAAPEIVISKQKREEQETVATWRRALKQQDEKQQSSVSSHPGDVGDNTFSACLIVKDDNHWLVEWLAYHYHVLPLRHLVVTPDPTSRTSPEPILQRWQDRIDVTLWTDFDFLPAWVTAQSSNKTSGGGGGLWLHLNRQKHFYGQCLQHLQRQGRTWVLLTDTDEFVRVHPVVAPLSTAVRSQAGHVVRFLETQLKQRQPPAQPPHQSLCLLAPRLQVAAVEDNRNRTEGDSPALSSLLSSLPLKVTQDLLTYRWLYHNGQEQPAGKNIIKLHPLDRSLPKAAHSVHHILEHCPRNTPGETVTTTKQQQSWLLIQHYLGTLEQFTFRDDPRDAVDNRPMQWHSRGQFPAPVLRDTGLTAWLPGWVQWEGVAVVRQLLQGAGQLAVTASRHPVTHPDADVHHHKKVDVYNATLVQQHLAKVQHEYEHGGANDPFGACLVTMDDNHWLIEWLAYHYHVLPLHRLLYVQDPHSRTDSQPIFHRWKDRMHITQWHDDQFIPPHIQRKHQAGNLTNAALHRYRQKFFYAACLRTLKREGNVTWALLADTDEFVRPNTLIRHGQRPKKVNANTPTLKKPGAMARFLQAQLRAHRVVSGNAQALDSHKCLYVPRLQMAAQEHNQSLGVPSGFDANQFLTLRWLNHNGQEQVFGKNTTSNQTHNLDGKNIINLQQVTSDDLPEKQVKNVHHVLPELCPASTGGQRLYERGTWLVLAHYLGTFEQYTFRHDPRDIDIPGRFARHNLTRFHSLGQPAHLVDTTATPWLTGFVEAVGLDEARRLLRNVGETTLPG